MTMTIGGLWFLAGAGLNAGARHLWWVGWIGVEVRLGWVEV